MRYGPFVEAAMRDAAVASLDERGLMPVEEARSVILKLNVYERGEGRDVRGQHVLASDVAWAAFMSLGDAEEFVREATRVVWKFDVRGTDSVAPVERYGEAILPWLASRIDDRGHLVNRPWCVRPCLLALGTEAALDVVLRVTDESHLLEEWMGTHPSVGYAALGQRAAQGDRRAEQALKQLATSDPGAAFDPIASTIGREQAEALFRSLGLPRTSVDPAIEEILDRAEALPVAPGPALTLGKLDRHFRAIADCPLWDNANYFTAGMRVNGFVSPEGDALIIQALVTGLGESDLRREMHVYSPVIDYARSMELAETLIPEDALTSWNDDETKLIHHTTGVTIDQKTGERTVPATGVRTSFQFELRGVLVDVPLTIEVAGLEKTAITKLATELGPDAVLMVQLGQYPWRERVFLSGARLAEHVGLPPAAQQLFQLEVWEHPPACEPASVSRDLVTMVEALRRRKRIDRLPSRLHPLEPLLRRLEVPGFGWGDPAAWGPAGSPVGKARAMTEDRFWELIETSIRESGCDHDRQVEALTQALVNLTVDEIWEFHEIFHDLEVRSYDRKLWAAAYTIHHGCSDDSFDYFRAWLISRGRKLFEQVLRDPDSLADVLPPWDGRSRMDLRFEEIMYTANEAYRRKVGAELPMRYYRTPRPRSPSGEDWNDADLPRVVPRLFARFWDPPSDERASPRS